MKHLLALAHNDFRVLYRTGYLWATLAVFALLLLIATQVSRLDLAGYADFVAAIILFDVVLTPVMIIGLMVLLERGEGSFIALTVTPLRRQSYVLARTATISLVSIAEMLLLVLIAYDGALAPASLVAGLLGVGAIASLFAFLAVAPFNTLYSFVLPMIGWIFFLGMPGYGVLLGWDPLWLAWHPTVPAMTLLKGAFTPLPLAEALYGAAGAIFWLGLGAITANRAVRHMQLRAVGG
ncbi:MAG: hypothetical protein R3C27_00745 [Hyphomonadaceae bacterium]